MIALEQTLMRLHHSIPADVLLEALLGTTGSSLREEKTRSIKAHPVRDKVFRHLAYSAAVDQNAPFAAVTRTHEEYLYSLIAGRIGCVFYVYAGPAPALFLFCGDERGRNPFGGFATVRCELATRDVDGVFAGHHNRRRASRRSALRLLRCSRCPLCGFASRCGGT